MGDEERTGRGLPFPLGLAALATASVIVARGLSRALPGSFAGIDAEISWVEAASAYLTQLSALSFAVISVRMVIQVLVTSLPWYLKLVSSLAALMTIAVVYWATGANYLPGHLWLVIMGLAASGLTFAAASRAVLFSASRLLGLLMVGAVLAGLLHMWARWLPLGNPAHAVRVYAAAQSFATAGFAIEILVGAAAFFWLVFPPPRERASPRQRRKGSVLRGIAVISVAFTTALVPAAQGAFGWRLLLGRTLTALRTHPDPLVPEWLANFSELWCFQVCVLCLLPWSRAPVQRACVVLVLLARASLDVPLGALFVVSAGLAVIAGSAPRAPSFVGRLGGSVSHQAS